MPPTDLLDGTLDLPPGFDLITLRESGDAFAHAKSIAGEKGAGTVVHVGRFDLAEFAVVLEPDEPLRTARRALYAGCVALADARRPPFCAFVLPGLHPTTVAASGAYEAVLCP